MYIVFTMISHNCFLVLNLFIHIYTFIIHFSFTYDLKKILVFDIQVCSYLKTQVKLNNNISCICIAKNI